MRWLLLVRPEAEYDLASARNWYDLKSVVLGDRFIDEIAAAMRELERHPELPRLYFRQFRCVRLRRFPYKIFYQVIDRRVVIFRVLHARMEHIRELGT